MTRIAAVIVNYRRPAETLGVLRSLAQSTLRVAPIFVFNYGVPESAMQDQREACAGVESFVLSSNPGYAAGNNLGIAAALRRRVDWILVLNDDVEFGADCVERLCAAGARDPRIGVVGPRLYHYDQPNVIQSGGGRLDRCWRAEHIAQNLPDVGDDSSRSDVCFDVDWLSGCMLMVRRAAIEQAGALDERFFLYWEEVEWCRRIAGEGWRLVHEPAARAWHRGVSVDYRPRPEVSYYMTRNRLLMLMLRRAPAWAWAAAWLEIVRAQAGAVLHRRSAQHRRMALRGAIDFLHGRFGPHVGDAGSSREIGEQEAA